MQHSTINLQNQQTGTIGQQQNPTAHQNSQVSQSQIITPQSQQQQQEIQKVDIITKAKNLIWPLKETLATTLRLASQNICINSAIDIGSWKGSEQTAIRFDKSLEDFCSYCDQLELCLKIAFDVQAQASSNQRYIQMPVSLQKSEIQIGSPQPSLDSTLSYMQYVNLARFQVNYVRDIHDSLIEASQAINPE